MMALDLADHPRRSPMMLSPVINVPLSPPDTDCPSPGSASPGRCSSSCSPAPPSPHPDPGVRELGHPHPHQQVNSIPITNFCIDEILKPNFGRAVSKDIGAFERHSAFSPWGRNSKRDRKTNVHHHLHHQQQAHVATLGAMFSRGLATFGFPYDLTQQSRTVSLPLTQQWMSTTAAAAAAAAAATVRSSKSKPYSYPVSRDLPAPISPPVSPTTSMSPIPKEEQKHPSSPAPHRETKPNKECPAITKTDPESKKEGDVLWPAWVYCTRYSDRPSSGPRSRKIKQRQHHEPQEQDHSADEKRPRTAFTNDQLGRLKREFEENRYLTEERRQRLAKELQLNESQIKIWFQNKRAKMKKATGHRNGLALQLMAQGLYNHSTVPVPDDDLDDEGMES